MIRSSEEFENDLLMLARGDDRCEVRIRVCGMKGDQPEEGQQKNDWTMMSMIG